MNTEHAIVEEKGHIMVITLNRPEKRNALSPGTVSYTHLTLPTTPYV